MHTELGPYLLVERLGTGTLTEAYRAKSFGVEGFEKAIVVKRVLPNRAELPGLLDAFVEQAKASLVLSHANVVQVIDLGRVRAELSGEGGPREQTYIATELVEGTDLGVLLAQARNKRVPLPVGLALFVAAEIAKALEHAHKRRTGAVVHGPLTPESVLVSWEGEIKVSDFALHRALAAVRFQPDEVRTLPYLSPEDLRSEAPKPASDVFSLGALLFELLTTESVFRGVDAEATRRSILASERPLPSSLRADVPREVDALVSRMLAREPSRRFGDAAGVHEELVALGYSLGGSPGQIEMAEFVSRLCRHAEPSAKPDDELPLSLLEATPVPASVARAEKREATLFCVTGLDALGERSDWVSRIERAGGLFATRDASESRVVFGLREPDGRDTEAAVLVALELLELAPDLSVGIDLGRVTADERGELVHDVDLGASFALAARLSASRKGRVSLSRAAGRAVEREVDLEADGDSSEALLARSRRVRGMPSSKFVGRRVELDKLGIAFAKAARGEPCLVFVSGERGTGKTRLVLELERRLAKVPSGAQFARAACPRDLSGAPAPLGAIVNVARAIFREPARGDLSAAPPHERKAEREQVVRKIRALGLDEAEASELTTLVLDGSNVGSEESVGRCLGRALARSSRGRPFVVALDDVQFLDPASARALSAALADPEPSRLCLVLSGRRLAGPLLERAETIAMSPLGDADVAVLAASLLGARVLPPELVSHLAERAEGNPLFVELIVKELSDAALVNVRQGVAQVDLERASVPRTLRALIEGRLARLEDQGARDVLRAMAVLGEGATEGEIAALVEASIDRVQGLVRSLEESGLVARAQLEGALGEVVLETIPEDDRRKAHARAAAIVEAGEATGDRLDRVAAHLAASGDLENAARRFARAAELHSTAGFQPEGAHATVGLGSFRAPRADLAARSAARALATAPVDAFDAAELGAWLSTLAEAVVRSRVRVGFADVAVSVLDRIDSWGDATSSVLSRLDVARIAAAESSFEQAEVVLAQARDRATAPDLLARTLAAEVELAERSGEIARGRDAARALIALGPVEDARVLLDAATLFAASLDLVDANRAIEMAYELALTDTAALRAGVEARRARVALVSGDASSAQRASLLAADLAEAHELPFDVASAKLTLADAHLALARPERAYAAFVEALEAAEGAGHERLGALARAGLVFLEGLRTKASTATAAPTALDRMAQETEARGFVADALVVRLLAGKLLAHRGSVDAARSELERTQKGARDVGHLALARDAARALEALDPSSKRDDA